MTRIETFRKRWNDALSNPAEAVAVFNDLLAYAEGLEKDIKGYEDWARGVNEALNSGDGSYHP